MQNCPALLWDWDEKHTAKRQSQRGITVKYTGILSKNLWPVVVWYFEGKDYLFMDDNASVYRARTVQTYKDQNEETFME